MQNDTFFLLYCFMSYFGLMRQSLDAFLDLRNDIAHFHIQCNSNSIQRSVLVFATLVQLRLNAFSRYLPVRSVLLVKRPFAFENLQ